MVLIPEISTRKNINILLFFLKKILIAKIIFCNADANDDADAEIPMPRFPNGLGKNTFWLLLPNKLIE